MMGSGDRHEAYRWLLRASRTARYVSIFRTETHGVEVYKRG